MVIPDLEVLGIILEKNTKNKKHQKDAQRNSVQKEVLNSSPSFFSASLVKKTLIRITGAPAKYQDAKSTIWQAGQNWTVPRPNVRLRQLKKNGCTIPCYFVLFGGKGEGPSGNKGSRQDTPKERINGNVMAR